MYMKKEYQEPNMYVLMFGKTPRTLFEDSEEYNEGSDVEYQADFG